MPALLVFLARFIVPFLRGFLPALMLYALKFFKFVRGLYLPVRIAMVVGVAAVLPLPDFLDDLPGMVASLPAGFQYFMGLVDLQFGVSVVMAAWVFRWVWRIIMKVF